MCVCVFLCVSVCFCVFLCVCVCVFFCFSRRFEKRDAPLHHIFLQGTEETSSVKWPPEAVVLEFVEAQGVP